MKNRAGTTIGTLTKGTTSSSGTSSNTTTEDDSWMSQLFYNGTSNSSMYDEGIQKVIDENNKRMLDDLEQQRIATERLRDSYAQLGDQIMYSLMGGSDSFEEFGKTTMRVIRDQITAYSALALTEAITAALSTAAAAGPLGTILIPSLVGAALGLTNTALNQIPGFADGGIVGGTSYTGDKVPAYLNSGEMILNSGQQKNLFKMINKGEGNYETVDVRFGYDAMHILMQKTISKNSKI
jgi:hypothetical protein